MYNIINVDKTASESMITLFELHTFNNQPVQVSAFYILSFTRK